MLLYPMKRCLSAVADARALTDCHTEPLCSEADRIFYRAALEADVGFTRPSAIVGLCVSHHDAGPLCDLPPEVLDAFDCDLCFDRLPKQIHIHLAT